ncbi:MAG: hypothetical protein HYR55_04030 [Acidobacteria bacterium]|nr:hypothetical protein [Acidobacteriota bacterium]
MLLIKGLLGSIPLMVILEMYYELVKEEPGLQETWLRDVPGPLTFLLIFVISNVAQIRLLRSSARRNTLQMLFFNLSLWFFFFLFYAIDAFTLHTGVAKDAQHSLLGFWRYFIAWLVPIGIPLAIINSVIARVYFSVIAKREPVQEQARTKAW